MALIIDGFFGAAYIVASLVFLFIGCSPFEVFKSIYKQDLVNFFIDFCEHSGAALAIFFFSCGTILLVIAHFGYICILGIVKVSVNINLASIILIDYLPLNILE